MIASPSGYMVVAFAVLGALSMAIGPALTAARRWAGRIVAHWNRREAPEVVEVNR
jgi:hypothetical protein